MPREKASTNTKEEALLTSKATWLSLMLLREGSKVVSNSTAKKEVELGEGWGRPMERAGKWVEEAMRKARPSPEGQEGEERMEKEKREEKEAVELVWGSRKRRG
ncbi:hypothetical protein DEO72_LG9g950 [Vigna unguiculata]|uniref:Uncharacterized protein n=1 Tax=Vigna unguiculata TaxID=3917 RepID=A0A4D6MZ97_VIGUN|nr:hypothetical protein DEO72_LG9g950 [Vigna unguiculata]